MTVRPLVPAAILFALGVALGLNSAEPVPWSGPAALVLLVAFGAAVLLRRRNLAALLGVPLFLALGLTATLQVGRSPGAHAAMDSGAAILLRGRVAGPVTRLPDGCRFLLREDEPVACSVGGAVRVTVGQGDPAVCRGDAVQLRARVRPLGGRRNPGSPDWPLFWARQGVLAEAYVSNADGVIRLQRGSGLLAAVDRARARVARVFAGDTGGSPGRGLLLALTTGERGRLDQGLRQRFVDAGLAHLLAVSGLHLAAVVGALFFLVRFLLSRSERLLLALNVRGLAAAIAILGGWAYALLAGATPATLRAAVLATVLLGALVVRRRPDLYSGLALAALGILAVDPAALAGPSFQLTFAAVLAIVAIVPRLLAVLRSWLPGRIADRLEQGPWRRLVEIPVVTLAALIGTGPLVALHFGQLSPVGLLANLVAVPLAAALVVPLALLSGVLALLWPSASEALLVLAEPLADLLAWVAQLFAAMPGAGVALPRPGWPGVIVLYLLVAGICGWRRRAGRVVAALALTMLCCLGLWRWLSPALSRDLSVTFLDVGRGDAILLRLPGGTAALVDGGSAGRRGTAGPDAGETSVLPALRALGVTELDRVYLTHGHEDHFGGLRAVIQALPVKGLIHDGQAPEQPGVQALFEAAEARHVPVRAARLSEVWRVGDVTVTVIHPAAADADLQGNDHALVLEVRYGRVGLLLAGDVQADGEARLLARRGMLDADVLKLPHHGSATSSGAEFLAAVSPALAVVTAGPSSGLPDSAVEERLRALHARVLTTGECGAITVRSDGEGLEVETLASCGAGNGREAVAR